MRTFSTDAPEFFAFKIEGSEEIKKIPLAGSMNNRDLLAFEETGGDYRKQVEWLRRYIGEAIDELSPATTAAIMKAWMEESAKSGASVGE